VLSLAAVLACNQFVYLDYGLTSRAGLEAARAAEKAANAAKRAIADGKAQQAREATAKAKTEADARQAMLDEKQAALDAKQAKEAEAAQAVTDAENKAVALAKRCKEKTLAFVMSQTFVKRQLKAPSSAEFPWITDDQVAISTRPGCVFHVSAWVDAQNGFGAQIRSRYVVDLKYLDDDAGSWQLIDIRIK
jgi:hypothetical protein